MKVYSLEFRGVFTVDQALDQSEIFAITGYLDFLRHYAGRPEMIAFQFGSRQARVGSISMYIECRLNSARILVRLV